MAPYAAEHTEAGGRGQNALALGVIVVALIVRLLGGDIQQQIGGALRGSFLLPFITLQEVLIQNRARGAELEFLRSEVDSLMGVVARQRTLAEENHRLLGLLDLRDRAGAVFRSATVLRPGTAGSASVFMVDVGSDQGVVAGAPVVTREGLVGVIREVGRGSSLGIDWTHPDFAVAAMTVDAEIFGIVESSPGRFREADRMLLSGTAFHEELEMGSLVVTSGLGGVYPRGIPLGTLIEEAGSREGWSRSYWVAPAVVAAGVTYAHVLVQRPEGGMEPLWELPEAEIVSDSAAGVDPAEGEVAVDSSSASSSDSTGANGVITGGGE